MSARSARPNTWQQNLKQELDPELFRHYHRGISNTGQRIIALGECC